MTNDIFPSDVREASDKIEGEWIQAKEFEGKGLTLQVEKPLEKMKSPNPKYGAKPENYLVKNNILEAGETFRYTFKSVGGNERKIDTNSSPFFIAFKQCEELGIGDWVEIVRTGETTETRYTVEKVEAPVAQDNPESLVTKSEDKMSYPEDLSQIPF